MSPSACHALTEIVVVGGGFLASRTRRALGEASPARDWGEALERRRPAWMLRAGAWTTRPVKLPPPSATGKPLVALGAVIGDRGWTELLARTGGLVDGAPPSVASIYAERPEELGELFVREGTLEGACARAARDAHARVVRVPSLDVTFDPTLRVIEVVTTLHRGGAERIALDLANRLGATLVVLDRASRSTYDAPPDAVSLAAIPGSRKDRIVALSELAHERGADVVHVHLLDGDEIHELARCGVPIAVTFHNSRPGWPARLDSIRAGDVALAIACSRSVGAELAGMPSPVRVAWNGIATRAPRSVEPPGLTLLAVANHRPQKRLDRMPAIVAALRARGHDATLTIVGEPVRHDAESLAIAERVRAEARRHGVEAHVTLEGTRACLDDHYAAASVALSTSAFEGLSLFHLEALAAGVPLVTTRVSGTEELAAKHPHVRLVEEDAPPQAFADAVLAAWQGPRGGLAPDFTTPKMASRHADLLVRAASRSRRRREGLLLVTNNFSTGGAQSSARRLLTTLRAAGIPVLAAVIQEQAAHPTPGRIALEAEGITVHVAPRAGLVDPIVTARAVADLVDERAPAAVLFWNVIPEHKILVADLLLDAPVWDVSPGEMYFASLERYFARTRIGSPYLSARDYGALLAGAIVKYEGERARAEDVLGARVHVVPNGVRVGSYEGRPPRDRVVVGTLARISPDKKLEQLVDAASPDFELRIAGGVERGCEAYAEDLRARSKHVTWCGEREASAFLAGCDLFAMVSEPAGCPNASLEAMAAGLAVVATDVGGAREQIVHGETGLLVPRGDVTALREAILDLARDPVRREAMGRAAHARACALFSVERMARDYARICLGVDLDDLRIAAE